MGEFLTVRPRRGTRCHTLPLTDHPHHRSRALFPTPTSLFYKKFLPQGPPRPVARISSVVYGFHQCSQDMTFCFFQSPYSTASLAGHQAHGPSQGSVRPTPGPSLSDPPSHWGAQGLASCRAPSPWACGVKVLGWGLQRAPWKMLSR